MSDRKSFFSSSLFQGISTIIKVLYSMLVAATFGATASMDSFVAASSIVIAINALLNNSQSNTLIPFLGKNEAESNNKLLQIGNLNFLLVLFAGGLLFLFSPILINVTAPGLTPEQQITASKLLRLLTATIVISNINAVGEALLKLQGKIETTFLFALVNSLISLIILFCLGKKMGISVFPLLQVVASIPFLIYSGITLRRSNFKIIPIKTFNFKIQGEYLRLLTPVLLSWFFVWLIKFTDNNIASRFSTGSMSYINYCAKISMFAIVLPNIICGMTFPKLSKLTNDKDQHNYSQIFNTGLSRLLLLLTPIGIITFIFGKSILGILFERGTFSVVDTSNISVLLKGYIFVIVCAPLGSYFSNVFFSYQRPKFAVTYSIVSSITNVILNIILAQFWGVLGLVIASSISFLLGTFLQGKSLHMVNPMLSFRKILILNQKILISGLITFMALLGGEPLLSDICQMVNSPFLAKALSLGTGSILTLILFSLCLFTMKETTFLRIVKR